MFLVFVSRWGLLLACDAIVASETAARAVGARPDTGLLRREASQPQNSPVMRGIFTQLPEKARTVNDTVFPDVGSFASVAASSSEESTSLERKQILSPKHPEKENWRWRYYKIPILKKLQAKVDKDHDLHNEQLRDIDNIDRQDLSETQDARKFLNDLDKQRYHEHIKQLQLESAIKTRSAHDREKAQSESLKVHQVRVERDREVRKTQDKAVDTYAEEADQQKKNTREQNKLFEEANTPKKNEQTDPPKKDEHTDSLGQQHAHADAIVDTSISPRRGSGGQHQVSVGHWKKRLSRQGKDGQHRVLVGHSKKWPRHEH